MPAQPRAAAGCGRCSSNPCIAICWPTPLSTEEPADTRGPGAAGTFGAKTLVLKSSTAQDLRGGGGHLRPQCPSKYRPFLLGCGCGKHGTAHLRPWDRVPSRLFLYRMARSGWPIPSLGLFPPLQRVEVDRPISKGPSRLWISLSCDFRYENQLGWEPRKLQARALNSTLNPLLQKLNSQGGTGRWPTCPGVFARGALIIAYYFFF